MSAPLIRFLRDCYEEDNRRSAIWNVFARSIEHRIFAGDREEVLTGELTQLPVDPDAAEPVLGAVRLYQRERELLYGALFIVGRYTPASGGFGVGPRTICAPLLLYPAQFVERDPYVFVEPDLGNERINDGLLDMLCGLDDAVDLSGAVRGIVRPGTLDFGDMVALKELLEHGIPGGCAGDLLNYPKLASDTDLRSAIRRMTPTSGRFEAFPASAVLLAPRSRAARGVVTELEAMAESTTLSAPVRVVLGEDVPVARGSHEPGMVPAVLSGPQRRIVRSAARNASSLVIGPPGTGKSFTIAALAIEHMSRGQTVLIASKMDHAVSVIEGIIEEQLGIRGCVVRGGPPAQRRKLADYVRELLAGMHTADVATAKDLEAGRTRLERLRRKLDKLETALTRRGRQEVRWSVALGDTGGGLSSVAERWARWRVERSRPLWELALEIEQAESAYVAHTRRHILEVYRRELLETLRDSRRTIQNLDRALRARTSGRQASLFENVDRSVLFRAFPIWLVTLSDIADFLPLEPDLFDLVIIDEATQCDIASSLPVLQRGRRCVVVGDPNQLRHISFVASDRQRSLAQKHALAAEALDDYNYRNHSILDLADRRLSSQDSISFLDEHFRSVPEIIRFSNDRFYAGRLRIMTDHPARSRTNGLLLHRCEGARDEEGVNTDEARRLVEDVNALIHGELRLPPERCHSIGVLSPFRSQADALAEMLAKELDAEAMRRHRLMLGTAHSFQGEERDAMFLSFAIDPETHHAALRYLERPDVFNVSITRARAVQHVYLSADASHFPADSLLRAYVQQMVHPEADRPLMTEDRTGDPHMRALADALRTEGLDVGFHYPLAGLTLDLLAIDGCQACGIDLVGFSPETSAMLPRERYQVLARAGLPVVPISLARWTHDPDGCVEAVLRGMEARFEA